MSTAEPSTAEYVCLEVGCPEISGLTCGPIALSGSWRKEERLGTDHEKLIVSTRSGMVNSLMLSRPLAEELKALLKGLLVRVLRLSYVTAQTGNGGDKKND